MKYSFAIKISSLYRFNAVLLTGLIVLFSVFHAIGQQQYPSVESVEKDFRALLQRPAVDFSPVTESFKTDSVMIEKGFIYAEENERIPLLIYKPLSTDTKSFPVVICLHGTGGSKDQAYIRDLLFKFTKLGFMGVAIDARYHGERITNQTDNKNSYQESIIKAWKNKNATKQEHPFFYDTVYDLWRLTDYLFTRDDVQKNRIGMTGISMGGIETWMAASVDERIKVAVPIIAAQSFKWSLENDRWQGRAGTIRGAHEQAAKDLGDTMVKKENVKTLWDKIIPGITDKFDCPSMIRLFAPRPLLLLSTELDVNCPLPGAEIAFKSATEAYRSKNAVDKLQINVQPKEPHRFTPEHLEMTVAWFGKWL
jgi:dienelactone hydrolase